MNVADLRKYKDSCYSALSRDLTEFEKNFLFIAAGILAFSTTFIKDLVKIPDVVWLPLLFGAWLLIIVSIGLMMYSFLKSVAASDSLLNTVDTFIDFHKLYEDKTDLNESQWLSIRADINTILSSSKRRLKMIRYWAVGFFITGILFFASFVAFNLVSEKNRSSGKNPATIEINNGNKKIRIETTK